MWTIRFLFPFGGSQISTLLLSAGLYACKEGSNSPCLVYVSFSQKIYIYWDVQLERMESTNLLKILDGDPEFESLLEQLDIGECRKSGGCTERKDKMAYDVLEIRVLFEEEAFTLPSENA